ncbi:MAG TPA: ABC transporter permease [Thermomicrobiaceae bacterium]|nr:ABC transporter permease [Thermomicrobiaceae bacterium]
MIADSLTVAIKEWKEMLKGGSRGRTASLILIAIYGIVFPLQVGRSWITGYQSIAFGIFVPFFLVFSVVADAIAGERERHTLETLLASRLSDRAILLGKIAAVTLYGWGLTMASLLLGLVTVNVTQGGGLEIYPAKRAAALVGFSLLVALLAAGIGVLASLRAATVRQAYQTLTVSWLVAFFAGIFGVQQLSARTQHRLLDWLRGIGFGHAALIVAAIVLLIDALLFALALARFQRARLILD